MNINSTLNDIYSENLKTPAEIAKEAQDKATASLKNDLHWQELIQQEGVQAILKKLDLTLEETHKTLISISSNMEYSDAQVRNFLVRYSTLYRTKNAVVNNNELI